MIPDYDCPPKPFWVATARASRYCPELVSVVVQAKSCHSMDDAQNKANRAAIAAVDAQCAIVVTPDPEVLGCMNPLASNYNPLATVSDDSCVFDPPAEQGEITMVIASGGGHGFALYYVDSPTPEVVLDAWALAYDAIYPSGPPASPAEVVLVHDYSADVQLVLDNIPEEFPENGSWSSGPVRIDYVDFSETITIDLTPLLIAEPYASAVDPWFLWGGSAYDFAQSVGTSVGLTSHDPPGSTSIILWPVGRMITGGWIMDQTIGRTARLFHSGSS